ncbi:MAG: hypothetical protein AB7R89_19475 [Dehalococcoidia bacterium]
MRGLQQLVCKSAIDPSFLHWLIRSPADAVRGFDLSAAETELVLTLHPQSLDELVRGVEAWRRGEPLPAGATAGVREAMPSAMAG